MKKINRITCVFTLFVLFLVTSINIHSASFTIAVNKTQVKVGEAFTVSIQGNVTGRFDATATNGTLNTSSILIDTSNTSGSFIVTPNGVGDVYVAVTAIAQNEVSTGSQGVHVQVLPTDENTNPSNGKDSQNGTKEPLDENANPDVMPINENVNNLVQAKGIAPTIGVDGLSSELNNEKVVIATTLGNFKTMKGFRVGTLKLRESIDGIKEIETLKHIKNGFLIVRGYNEKTNKENLYMFDKKSNKLVGVMKQININNKDYFYMNALKYKEYTKVDINKDLFVIAKNKKINKETLDVLKYKDKNMKDYSILYLMDENGNFEWIQYERTSNTFQPYKMSSATSLYSEPSLFASNNHKTIGTVLFIAVSLSVTLINIAILIINLRKNKQYKRKTRKNSTLENAVQSNDDSKTNSPKESPHTSENTETIVMDKVVAEIPNDEYTQSEDIDIEGVVLEFIKMQTRDELEKSEQLLNEIFHPSEDEADEVLNRKLSDFIKLNNKLLYLVSNQIKIAKYPNVEINKIIASGKKGYYKAVSEIKPTRLVTQDTLFRFRQDAVQKIVQSINEEFKK